MTNDGARASPEDEPEDIHGECAEEIARLTEDLEEERRRNGQHPAGCKPDDCGKCRRDATITALRAELAAVTAERDEAKKLINTPEVLEFVDAVQLEAAHQRMRWRPEDDAAKSDADWFWLIGWLAGKAVHNPGESAATPNASAEKRLHRIVTVAAAACNWHAARRREYLASIGVDPSLYGGTGT